MANDLKFPNYANTLFLTSHANYFNQRAKLEADQAQRQNDAEQYIDPAMQGDQTAFAHLAANNPQAGNAVSLALQRLSAQHLAKVKQATDFATSMGIGIMSANPADRPALYAQARQQAQAQGLDTSQWPPDYDEGWTKFQMDRAQTAKQWFDRQAMQPQVLGDGGSSAMPQTQPGQPGQPDYGKAISGIESGGNYAAVGPVANPQGDRAYGKYQVMGANVGPWTQEVLGKAMTPQEFLANPQAQDAVFKAKFGQYLQQTGNPQDAASMWFSGRPLAGNNAGPDVNGTTVAAYVNKFNRGLYGNQPQMVGAAAPPNANGQGDSVPALPPGLPPGAIPIPTSPGTAQPTPIPNYVPGTAQPQLAQAQTPADVASLKSRLPQGYRLIGTRATPTSPLLPTYDKAGRLYVMGPNGPDWLEIPKPAPLPAGMRYGANGQAEVIPGVPQAQAQLYNAKYGGGVPPDIANLHGDDFRATDYWNTQTGDVRNNVAGLLDGSIPVSTLSKRGMGENSINHLTALAKQIDPTWSPNIGEQGKRFAMSLVGNGQNAQTVQSMNVAPRHGADLVKLTDAIAQNNPQAVQGIINGLKTQFGDTAVPNMVAARNLVALEFLRAAVGPGALNQQLEQEFIRSISTNATADQVRSIVANYVDKMMERGRSLQETAKTYNIPQNQIIHPETQKYIDFLEGKKVEGMPTPKAPEPSLYERGLSLFRGSGSTAPSTGTAAQPPAGVGVKRYNPATGALE